MSDPADLTVSEAADLMRRGEVSSREITEAVIDRAGAPHASSNSPEVVGTTIERCEIDLHGLAGQERDRRESVASGNQLPVILSLVVEFDNARVPGFEGDR